MVTSNRLCSHLVLVIIGGGGGGGGVKNGIVYKGRIRGCR